MLEDSVPAHLSPILVNVGSMLSGLLSSSLVTFFLVPIIATVGAVLLKKRARHKDDRDEKDWLFGFDLGLTACFTLLISGFLLVNTQPSSGESPLEKEYYLIGLFVVLVGFVILLTFGASMMSKKGWEKEGEDYEMKRNWVLSIDIVGAVLLIIAFILSGGELR